jgi:hypothetical protein
MLNVRLTESGGLVSIVHRSLGLSFSNERKENTVESRRKVRYNIFAMFVLLLTSFMFCMFGFFAPGASPRSVYFISASFPLLAALLFLGLYLKYR